MTADGRRGTDETARLFVVGTPIGNLADLSPRAAEVLASVDAVICEDTRRTGRLLAHIGTGAARVDTDGTGRAGRTERADLLVANEHTEVPRIAEVIDRLDRGQRLALVTDAGMPTISDPGEQLIRAVTEHGVPVEVIPGPTAVSAALALSALPTGRYVFEGFLPRKGRERTDRLTELAAETRTVVVYEAPHRIQRTLADLASVCGGDRPVAVARELTKLHEEVLRTTLAEAHGHFDEVEPRGEFVLVVAGRPTDRSVPTDEELRSLLREQLDGGLSRRDAVVAVVADTGQPKRRVYDLATSL
ncbi:MAG: 16S rRNA (cytidine(1402)-2'-O)-methyltransferase [Actinomycetota bacterium]